MEYYSPYFIITIGDNDGNFSRSAARNAGVSNAKSDIITLIDADNLIHPKMIMHSVTLAKHTNLMVKPFKWFGYLDAQSTEWVYDIGFNNVDMIKKNFQSPPQQRFNGGAYTISRHNWHKVGGFDEAFVGWGAEDDAFHIMCKRVLGETQHVSGMAYHLYHPAHRVTSKDNYDYLMERYVNGN